MAQYLIVDDGSKLVRRVEAKNMKEAAQLLFAGSEDDDGYTADIYRVAGAPKRITLSVETVTKVSIE